MTYGAGITRTTTYRALEITVISGENLRAGRRHAVKKNAFVIITTDSSSSDHQRTTTRMDKDGGSFPAWDEKFVLDMPMHARFVIVEVQCKINGGNRIIGTARIPISDFTGGFVPDNYLHFLSYRLWDSDGERNGIINLSIRVKSSGSSSGNSNAAAPKVPWYGSAAGPAHDHHAKVSNPTAVMGIPVWPTTTKFQG